jgi:hypothetical protein
MGRQWRGDRADIGAPRLASFGTHQDFTSVLPSGLPQAI